MNSAAQFLTVLPARVNNGQEPSSNEGVKLHGDKVKGIIDAVFKVSPLNMKAKAWSLLSLMINEHGKHAPEYAIAQGFFYAHIFLVVY